MRDEAGGGWGKTCESDISARGYNEVQGSERESGIIKAEVKIETRGWCL